MSGIIDKAAKVMCDAYEKEDGRYWDLKPQHREQWKQHARALRAAGLLVVPHPAPSPSAAHAELLRKVESGLIVARAIEAGDDVNAWRHALLATMGYAADLMDALRAASPSPLTDDRIDEIASCFRVRCEDAEWSDDGYFAPPPTIEVSDRVRLQALVAAPASPSPGAVEAAYTQLLRDVERVTGEYARHDEKCKTGARGSVEDDCNCWVGLLRSSASTARRGAAGGQA